MSAFVAVANADWNQWRGPNRDGKIPNYSAPKRWPGQLARLWRVEVGEGHSSPLIVGDHVFIFTRQGNNEVARCLRASSGREVWTQRYPAPYEMDGAAQAHGKGPKSTPVYAEGRLYTFGISGILSCFDAATGKVIWRRTFASDFQKTSPLYGAAMSPLVENGLLIAHIGGHNQGALVAFDARTGQPRWNWGGDGPAYASPVLATLSGTRQIITQTQKHCIGVDFNTGKLLWRIPFTTPYDQNIVTPVVTGDTIIFGGTQQPTFACQVRKNGAAWSVQKLWQSRDVTMYMSSPILSGNRLYGMSERRSGQMFCMDVTTGKTLWVSEGRFGEHAAVLEGGSALFALNTDADLVVFGKNGNALAPLAKYRVAESATWASPSISNNRLYIKDFNTLSVWALPQ
jgi:outer membrane protein assembly factor BamB